MTFSLEMREAALTAIGPVPYLILLMPILVIVGETGVVALLFVLSLIAAFFYLFVIRSVGVLRSNLAKRKESIPDAEDRYNEGPF